MASAMAAASRCCAGRCANVSNALASGDPAASAWFSAVARARLAADVVRERLVITGAELDEIRYDLIGINSLYGDKIASAMDGAERIEPNEIRLRVSGRSKQRAMATKVANEVEALYTNGPAGGAGASKLVEQIVSICSIFVPRDEAPTTVSIQEV